MKGPKTGFLNLSDRLLGNLGSIYADLGDAHRAIDVYEQALAIRREIGDWNGVGKVLGNLGTVYDDLGNPQRAVGYYEQRLAIARKIGDRRGEGTTLGNLGNAYVNLGDTQHAIDIYKQALAIQREIEDIDGVANVSLNMARLYVQQDDITRAIPLAQEAVLLWKQIGSPNRQRAEQFMVELQKIESQKQKGLAEAKQAFQAFQDADSLPAMRRAVAQFPLMRDPKFMTLVEQSIQQYVPSHLKPAFEQRRKWLRQIVR